MIMRRYFRTMIDESKLKLRQEVLGILMKKFGNECTNQSIYECADEWCSKQVSSNGIVSYFEAYYK